MPSMTLSFLIENRRENLEKEEWFQSESKD